MSDTTSTRTASSRLSWRLSARELINVAIFAAIYVVITYMLGMLSLFGPMVWLISAPLAIVVNGVTFMLFYTRVRHAGMLLLFSTVMALFFVLHGGAIVGAAVTLVLGAVTEVIAYAGRYRTRWSGIACYTVFGVTGFVPFLPILINREAYFGSTGMKSMGGDFVRVADELFTVPVMAGLAAVCLVAGLIGGVFGTLVLRKHFVRAGLA